MVDRQLSDDIKAISFLHDRDFFPDDNGSWDRIKNYLQSPAPQDDIREEIELLADEIARMPFGQYIKKAGYILHKLRKLSTRKG